MCVCVGVALVVPKYLEAEPVCRYGVDGCDQRARDEDAVVVVVADPVQQLVAGLGHELAHDHGVHGHDEEDVRKH